MKNARIVNLNANANRRLVKKSPWHI